MNVQHAHAVFMDIFYDRRSAMNCVFLQEDTFMYVQYILSKGASWCFTVRCVAVRGC